MVHCCTVLGSASFGSQNSSWPCLPQPACCILPLCIIVHHSILRFHRGRYGKAASLALESVNADWSSLTGVETPHSASGPISFMAVLGDISTQRRRE